MGLIIAVCFAAKWTKPVYVGTGDELDITITGPGDAIRYMHTGFKHKRGQLYWRAHSLCHYAIAGQVHPDLARQSFLDAWLDQGLQNSDG